MYFQNKKNEAAIDGQCDTTKKDDSIKEAILRVKAY